MMFSVLLTQFISHNTDTAGAERFRTITHAYYRGALIIIIAYDVTGRSSFASCDRWIEEVKEHCNDQAIVVAVGNKIDLKEKRKVEKEDRN